MIEESAFGREQENKDAPSGASKLKRIQDFAFGEEMNDR